MLPLLLYQLILKSSRDGDIRHQLQMFGIREKTKLVTRLPMWHDWLQPSTCLHAATPRIWCVASGYISYLSLLVNDTMFTSIDGFSRKRGAESDTGHPPDGLPEPVMTNVQQPRSRAVNRQQGEKFDGSQRRQEGRRSKIALRNR